MSDYASSVASLFYGTTSSPGDAVAQRSYTATPTAPVKFREQKISAATGGTNFDTSDFSAIAELLVWNRDTTNYVTLSYTCASSNAAQVEKILAGQWVKLVDVKANATNTITANSAACVCELWAVGT